jgi:hypothetical protein
MEVLGTETGMTELSPLLPIVAVFSLLSLIQKTRISEECNKDVKFTNREPNECFTSNYFMAPQNAKIF